MLVFADLDFKSES